MCGKVAYEVRGDPLAMYHCHCQTCRSASGASFVTNIAVKFRELEVVEGARILRGYQSSPGKFRYFCGECGSPIYSHASSSPELASVRAGTLLDDPGIRPEFHAFISSAAPWVEVCDDIPTFSGSRPA